MPSDKKKKEHNYQAGSTVNHSVQLINTRKKKKKNKRTQTPTNNWNMDPNTQNNANFNMTIQNVQTFKQQNNSYLEGEKTHKSTDLASVVEQTNHNRSWISALKKKLLFNCVVLSLIINNFCTVILNLHFFNLLFVCILSIWD